MRLKNAKSHKDTKLPAKIPITRWQTTPLSSSTCLAALMAASKWNNWWQSGHVEIIIIAPTIIVIMMNVIVNGIELFTSPSWMSPPSPPPPPPHHHHRHHHHHPNLCINKVEFVDIFPTVVEAAELGEPMQLCPELSNTTLLCTEVWAMLSSSRI